MDDLWRLRLRNDAFRTPWPSLASGGSPAFVGKVTTASPAVATFVLVNPVTVTGAEVEGGPGVLTADPDATIPVYLIGPGVPATGDDLVCRFVDYRWVAERVTGGTPDGGKVGVIPNCFCTAIPATLAMTSADPNCNFGMFQSCSIRWGPTPEEFAPLAIGENSFLSTESFPDPITNGALFRYLLVCQFNQFSLTRLYPESPFGSPYRDGVLYSWLIGATGNTCVPFHLDNGRAFPGSDPTCIVTIDG
jgi:hypothetical protein